MIWITGVLSFLRYEDLSKKHSYLNIVTFLLAVWRYWTLKRSSLWIVIYVTKWAIFMRRKINTLETEFTAFHFVKEQVPLLICHFPFSLEPYRTLSYYQSVICQEAYFHIMNDSQNSTCEVLMHHYAVTTKVDHLRYTYISNCILNSLLSHPAIMLNIVTIHAIRKTSSLPKTLKTLLLSLAVSDIGVGCIVQPFYISLLIKNLLDKIPSCNTYNMFGITLGLFSIASFLGVVAVSVDRFLAVHLHLRYQELVTHKRVIAVVILIWLLSVFLTSLILWVPFLVHSIFLIIFGLSFFLVTTTVYVKIYQTVRHHKKQIQSLQRVQQVEHIGEMSNMVSVLKSAVGIFYMYLVFVACYLPYLVCLVVADTTVTSNSIKSLYLFSYTILFLNSSLNPVIYCWKLRHIRHTIMDIMRNMPWNRKHVYSTWHRSVTTESVQDEVQSVVCSRIAWIK